MAASAEGKSTMRNVFSVDVSREDAWGENLVVITVKGNAFLHSMVRTIVGTLVAVGLWAAQAGMDRRGARGAQSRGGGRKMRRRRAWCSGTSATKVSACMTH